MRRLALVAAAGLAALAVAAGVASLPASAHPSDCHAERSCPADDGSYVWYDGSGQGWTCVAADPGAGTTVFGDDEYSCSAASPPPPAETVTTAPPEPEPPPPTATTATEQTTTRSHEVSPAPPSRGSRSRAAGSGTGATGATGSAGVRPFPVLQAPSSLRPKLTAGGYVFPVYGPAAFVDTWGAPRATVSWHHGTDIFAPLGAPVLAVADGTVFSVGWNDIGGNRLWLRDTQGNEFYYAHLSAFSPLAINGQRVRAGAVLGFIGNTGDAVGTPPHLHFEVHPVSLLALGYDASAVNPTPYLRAWKRLVDLPIGTALSAAWDGFSAAAAATAPQPGAILLESSDISRARSLDARSLRRAMTSSPTATARLVAETRAAAGTTGADRVAQRVKRERALRRQAVEFARTASLAELEEVRVWDSLAQCESSGDWAADTGNGYAGGLQFAPGTWFAYGGTLYASTAAEATRAEQIVVARRVLSVQGWGAWPACSAKLGLGVSMPPGR